MTLTEKTLARASGKAQVQPVDDIWVKAVSACLPSCEAGYEALSN